MANEQKWYIVDSVPVLALGKHTKNQSSLVNVRQKQGRPTEDSFVYFKMCHFPRINQVHNIYRVRQKNVYTL